MIDRCQLQCLQCGRTLSKRFYDAKVWSLYAYPCNKGESFTVEILLVS